MELGWRLGGRCPMRPRRSLSGRSRSFFFFSLFGWAGLRRCQHGGVEDDTTLRSDATHPARRAGLGGWPNKSGGPAAGAGWRASNGATRSARSAASAARAARGRAAALRRGLW